LAGYVSVCPDCSFFAFAEIEKKSGALQSSSTSYLFATFEINLTQDDRQTDKQINRQIYDVVYL